jgi:hypothetical protein
LLLVGAGSVVVAAAVVQAAGRYGVLVLVDRRARYVGHTAVRFAGSLLLIGVSGEVPFSGLAGPHGVGRAVQDRHLGLPFTAPCPGVLVAQLIAMLAEPLPPGLRLGTLQTAEYAAAILQHVVDFYEIPDDVEHGVAIRMERQHYLYRGERRFNVILGEQAVYANLGDPSILKGQLDRLLRRSRYPASAWASSPLGPPSRSGQPTRSSSSMIGWSWSRLTPQN